MKNIPQAPTRTHAAVPYCFLLHCSHDLQLRQRSPISLEKKQTNQKQCASHINKAEDGYDIGTHAVEKHPVNNILRLKQGLPVRLNMIGWAKLPTRVLASQQWSRTLLTTQRVERRLVQ